MSNFSNSLHFIAKNLAIELKTDDTINGFQFKNMHKEIKYLQYADDIYLTLKTHHLKMKYYRLLNYIAVMQNQKLI